jgi:hypothetical protein
MTSVTFIDGQPVTPEELFNAIVDSELARADAAATGAIVSGCHAIAHSIAAAAAGEKVEAIEAAAAGLRALAAGTALQVRVKAVRAFVSSTR